MTTSCFSERFTASGLRGEHAGHGDNGGVGDIAGIGDRTGALVDVARFFDEPNG